MYRDFTYINDIVTGVINVVEHAKKMKKVFVRWYKEFYCRAYEDL